MNNDYDLNLHSMTKLPGWLCYWQDSDSTILFNIVGNHEQCLQKNIVQSWYTAMFFLLRKKIKIPLFRRSTSNMLTKILTLEKMCWLVNYQEKSLLRRSRWNGTQNSWNSCLMCVTKIAMATCHSKNFLTSLSYFLKVFTISILELQNSKHNRNISVF